MKILQTLTRYCQRQNTHPSVTNLMITNLHHWMENIQHKPTTPSKLQQIFKLSNHTAYQLHKACKEQQLIGWEQILHGRISKKWETIATSNWTSNNKKWTTGFINKTVRAAIDIWQFRVDNKFGTNEETREKNRKLALQPKIEKAYKKINNLTMYHEKLLTIPLPLRLTFSSQLTKDGLDM